MTYIAEKIKKTRTWLNNAKPLDLGMDKLCDKNSIVPPCLILFVFVITIYSIIFRVLRIDLLRLKKQDKTYWLEMEDTKHNKIWKQY